MPVGHVRLVGGVLSPSAAPAPVLGDDLATVEYRDARGGEAHVHLPAYQRVRNGVVHVVHGHVIVRRDLRAAPLAPLVGLWRQRLQAWQLLGLPDGVPRAFPGRERAAVEPVDALGAELVELLQRVECHLVRGRDDPLLNEVDGGLGRALVAGLADPRRHHGGSIVLGESLVLPVHERDVDRAAVGRRRAVVGHQHAGHTLEVVERMRLAVLPGRLPHVAEALRPEPAGEGQDDDQHVDLGDGAREAVGEVGDVPRPVYVALGPGLVLEVARRTEPVGLLGEHLAERLVRVGKQVRLRRLLAVLGPHELDGEPAVALLALDEPGQVGPEVRGVRATPLPGEERVIHGRRVHRAHLVERERVLPHDPRGRRHVTLADVQGGGDLGLTHPSLRYREEDLLVLAHGHQPLP